MSIWGKPCREIHFVRPGAGREGRGAAEEGQEKTAGEEPRENRLGIVLPLPRVGK